MRLAAFALCAGLVLSGAAAAQSSPAEQAPPEMRPAEGRDCFRISGVRRYAVIDDHNIRVRFTRARTYTLTTSEDASDLDFGRRLRVTSDTGFVCAGDVRGAVYVVGGDMGNRYGIDTVTRDPYPPPETPEEKAD
jgi:hypothetical protein